MNNQNELRELLTEEQIIHILRRLGSSEHRDENSYISFRTICHNEDEGNANFNLVYYKDTKLFTCFSECGETFDIFRLVKKRFEIDGEDTHIGNIYYFILNYSDLDFSSFTDIKKTYNDANQYRATQLSIQLPEYSHFALDTFNKRYCVEWEKDGITEQNQDKFNIKYSISQNKIIIPHYDIDNRLVGIRGRALCEFEVKNFAKYAPVKVEQIIHKHPLGMNLYGLNLNKGNIEQTGVAIIVESEKAVLQAENILPINVAVAVCGSTFNKWQLMLLLRYCNVQEIIFAYDREEKGNEEKYFNKLYQMGKKYSQYCKMSFIYNNKELEMKENMFDKRNKELIAKLIKQRVEIK